MRKEQLAEYLKNNCLGEANAITGPALARCFGTTNRQLRDLVNSLRQISVPIASSAEGYFYAKTAKEAQGTICHLKHRIAGIAAAIRGLERAIARFDENQLCLPLEGGEDV